MGIAICQIKLGLSIITSPFRANMTTMVNSNASRLEDIEAWYQFGVQPFHAFPFDYLPASDDTQKQGQTEIEKDTLGDKGEIYGNVPCLPGER